jgi:hypothetical protein
VFVCGTDEENECKTSLKKNMPLGIASLFFFFFFFSVHTEQTNYVKQKIDGLWKFSREHKRCRRAIRLKTEVFFFIAVMTAL